MIFAINLIPPRPDFAQTMTETEQAVMGAHATYWRGLLADGVAVVFGPVADPAGTYGLAVIEVGDRAAADEVTANDPAVRHGLTTRCFPLMGGFVRPVAAAHP